MSLDNYFEIRPLHDSPWKESSPAERDQRVKDILGLLERVNPALVQPTDRERFKSGLEPGAKFPILGSLVYNKDRLVAYSAGTMTPDGNIMMEDHFADHAAHEDELAYLITLEEAHKFFIHFVEKLQKSGKAIGIMVKESSANTPETRAMKQADMLNLSSEDLKGSGLEPFDYAQVGLFADELASMSLHLWIAPVRSNNGQSVDANLKSLFEQYKEINPHEWGHTETLKALDNWRNNVQDPQTLLSVDALYRHVDQHMRNIAPATEPANNGLG
jgi:hypothetical protein